MRHYSKRAMKELKRKNKFLELGKKQNKLAEVAYKNKLT